MCTRQQDHSAQELCTRTHGEATIIELDIACRLDLPLLFPYPVSRQYSSVVLRVESSCEQTDGHPLLHGSVLLVTVNYRHLLVGSDGGAVVSRFCYREVRLGGYLWEQYIMRRCCAAYLADSQRKKSSKTKKGSVAGRTLRNTQLLLEDARHDKGFDGHLRFKMRVSNSGFTFIGTDLSLCEFQN